MTAKEYQLTVRIDTDTVDRADRLVEHVARLGGKPTGRRVDVWREALLRGLAALEVEAKAKK